MLHLVIVKEYYFLKKCWNSGVSIYMFSPPFAMMMCLFCFWHPCTDPGTFQTFPLQPSEAQSFEPSFVSHNWADTWAFVGSSGHNGPVHVEKSALLIVLDVAKNHPVQWRVLIHHS